MGFHLRNHEPVDDAVRRIAIAELDASMRDVLERQPDSHEAVHDFRKRCKKMRGLIRVVRPHLGRKFAVENAFFRDLSRQLSYVRDTQALLEALDRLEHRFADEAKQYGGVKAVRDHLLAARDQAGGGEAQLVAQLEALVDPLQQARERVAHWEIPRDGFDVLAPGLAKTYKRARRAMTAAYESNSAEAFHEWRKRVKYHWHHSLLLRRICPPLMKSHRQVAETLGELLGQDHDYAVLRQQLSDVHAGADFDKDRRILFQWVDRRQAEMRQEMWRLGSWLQAEKPGRLMARWHAYWKTWRRVHPEKRS